jgi:hypothetical protein
VKTPSCPTPGSGRIHRLRRAVAGLLGLPPDLGNDGSTPALSAREERMISVWLLIAAAEAVSGVMPWNGAALGLGLWAGQTLNEDQFMSETHPGG